jgi:IS30 family transposase
LRRAGEAADASSPVATADAKAAALEDERHVRGLITDTVSIRERPTVAEDRAVPGHWEGGLRAGSGNTYIATLLERRSRFTLLLKFNQKDTQSMANALAGPVRTPPRYL